MGKTMIVSAKCSDLCCIDMYDENGNQIYEHVGYVPDFMPGQHFGDYVQLDIDIDTGVILNWQPNQVKKAIKRG